MHIDDIYTYIRVYTQYWLNGEGSAAVHNTDVDNERSSTAHGNSPIYRLTRATSARNVTRYR